MFNNTKWYDRYVELKAKKEKDSKEKKEYKILLRYGFFLLKNGIDNFSRKKNV